jgi:hypothetical protein
MIGFVESISRIGVKIMEDKILLDKDCETMPYLAVSQASMAR